MKQILLRLDDRQYQELKKAAEADSRGIASACRAAIAAYITEIAKKGAGK